MANSSVTWDLIARDRASQTVGRVGGSVDKLTHRVTRLATAFGGAFALERAGEFALKMADQFELSRSRLETITKNIGGDFDAISGQVIALDNRLAAFGFTNADVEGAVASLETATKDVPKALKDVALAADIARGRNISLEESTRILQRVETGHVTMLSRLGIPTIDKTTGKILTQKQALDLLTKTYSGTASHFADTFAGKQEALRAELANSAAEIGVALLPAAVDLARVIQVDLLPPVQKAAEFFDRNRKTIEPLIGLVLKLAIAYKALKIARSAAEALRGVGPAKAAVGAEVASLAKPVPVFVTNWGGGKVPPVVAGGKTAATAEVEAAAEASAGAAIGSAMASNLGRGARILSRILQAAKFAPAAGVGAVSDMRTIQEDPGFTKTLAAVQGIRKQAGETPVSYGQFFKALERLGYDPYHGPATQKQLESVAMQFTSTARAAAKLADAQQQVTASTRNESKALAHLQARSLALSSGQDDLRQAIHNMAVVAGGQASGALRGNSDAALANRDALRGAVSSAEAYLKTLKDNGASAGHVAHVELVLSRAIRKNADETYGNKKAVDRLLRSLGFMPGQIADVVAALKAARPVLSDFDRQVAGMSDHVENLAQRGIFADKKKAHDRGAGDGRSYSDGYSDVVVPEVEAASTKAADAAQAAFDKAKQRMRADVQEITGYLRQEKSALLSSFASLSTDAMTDSLGGSYNRPQSIVRQLKQDAQKAHTFARLWTRLANLGVDRRILAQFAGPEYIPAMRELLAGGEKAVRRANRLERRIAHDLGRVAVQATEGKYDRLIHEDIRDLPPKLEKGFERALRRNGLKVIDIDRRQGDRVAAQS